MWTHLWIAIITSILVTTVPRSGFAHAQKVDGPHFDTQLQTFRPSVDAKSGLTCNLAIRQDDLQFLNINNRFEARFEVQIVLWEKDTDELVYDRSVTKTVHLETFEETNVRDAITEWSGSIQVPPGQYRIQFLVTDLNNKHTSQREDIVELQNYTEPGLKISRISFLQDLEIGPDDTPTMIPQVGVNISTDAIQFLAYLEIYTEEEDSPVNVSYQIRHKVADNDLLVKQGEWIIFQHARKDYILTDLREFSLPLGAYKIMFAVTENNITKAAAADFTVAMESLPPTITDFDVALQQLRYIATGKEFKAIQQETIDARLQAFHRFWKLRDPNPDTVENEKMIEYYQRAAYASLNFKFFRSGDGWKSDQGMVYMMYGPPDDLERRDLTDSGDVFFSARTAFGNSLGDFYAYEVWYYFWHDYDPIVEFVDETNTGSFLLMKYDITSLDVSFRGRPFTGRDSDMKPPPGAKYPGDEDFDVQNDEQQLTKQ